MHPLKTKTHAHRTIRAVLLGALGSAVLVFALATPAQAVAVHVDICHKTGNGYVLISPSASGVFNGHLGESHHDALDVIPPFTYKGEEYSQNWDAEGMALFENECDPESTSTTTTGPPGEEVPFFTSATTLLVGVGGALAGTLLMLRRKL